MSAPRPGHPRQHPGSHRSIDRLTVTKLPRMPLEWPAQRDTPQEGKGSCPRSPNTARVGQPSPPGHRGRRIYQCPREPGWGVGGGLAVHTPQRLGAWEPAHASRSREDVLQPGDRAPDRGVSGHSAHLVLQGLPLPQAASLPSCPCPAGLLGDQSPRFSQALVGTRDARTFNARTRTVLGNKRG